MDKNLEAYNSKAVVTWYNNLKGIIPVEHAVFENHKDAIAAANLLDIGVGGGRTTEYLVNRCKNYTGIDYSQGFVDTLKKKYAGASIITMDARKLLYADNSFDFINFSFNGIDYADPDGRKKIFAEIYRVLKPGGIFFFSTHNKSHSSFDEWPWLNKKTTPIIKLKTFIKLVPFLPRKIKNQAFELSTNDFAIINDSAHNYSLMTFYTTPQFLRQQLAKENFTEIIFYNRAGLQVPDEKLDDWIYTTVKKTA